MIRQRPCRTCGNPLPEGAKHCPQDGTAVDVESHPDDKTALRTALEVPAQQYPAAGEADTEWESTVRKDILVGQRIGEYVVRRRIGSGGMGVVYEGEHPVIGRKVAIKIIRPDTSEGLRSRDLVGEARAASAIRHRGIIDIFGFGTLPGIGQYLVMEYLNGRPLDEVIMDRAPMSAAEVIRLIIEVLGALSAAHAMGVIHRDLKPGNIFVVLESNGSEYVKVLDFGLAKQGATPNSATPQTRASMIVGTPEYMAPEQACGQPVSPRTDLYAVGIIMFEMLTGRLPFRGDSPMHVAIQQVQAQPPAPSSLVDGLPAELEALILRLLAKEPEQRPGSAEAVARELKAMAKVLAADMTQLSGFARTVSEPEPPSVRPPAPQRGAPAPRPSAAPPETVDAPKTVLTGSRNTVAPQALARPQPGRAQPPARAQASAPQTELLPAEIPDTAEMVPVGRSSPRMKLLAGVGAAVVLLGVGVGVVMHKGDSGPVVPEPTSPTRASASIEPKPKPQPQAQQADAQQPGTPQTGAPQTGTPPAQVTADPQPKVETPAQPETPPSAQTVATGPEQTPAAQKTGSTATKDPKAAAQAVKGSSGPALRIISKCFREVYVDGIRVGDVVGAKTFSVLAGPRELELRNPGVMQDYVKKVDVKASGTVLINAPCLPKIAG